MRNVLSTTYLGSTLPCRRALVNIQGFMHADLLLCEAKGRHGQ